MSAQSPWDWPPLCTLILAPHAEVDSGWNLQVIHLSISVFHNVRSHGLVKHHPTSTQSLSQQKPSVNILKLKEQSQDLKTHHPSFLHLLIDEIIKKVESMITYNLPGYYMPNCSLEQTAIDFENISTLT